MAIIVGKFNSERNGSPHFMGKNGEHGYRFESLPPLQLYPDYIQIISRLYPHRWLSTPDVPLYHDFWCQTSRPPSGGPGSAGSTSAGSGRAVGHFPPAHAEGVRPRSGNFDENCLGAPCTTKRYSNLQ